MAEGEAAGEEFQNQSWVQSMKSMAMAAALTDAMFGGFQGLKDIVEVRALAIEARAFSTVLTDVGKAARVAELVAIGERAAKLADKLAADLRFKLVHELIPRATVPASLFIMLDELAQTKEPEEALSFMQHYAFHVVAIARV